MTNKLADGTIADGKNRDKYKYCIYLKKGLKKIRE